MPGHQTTQLDSHPTIPGLQDETNPQILMSLQGVEISEKARHNIDNVRTAAKKIADLFSEGEHFSSIAHLELALRRAQDEIRITKFLNS